MQDMAVFRRGSVLLAFASAILARDAQAQQPGMCRVVNLDFTPGGIAASSDGPEIAPQIVAWLEKPNGEYVRTVYITQQTGRYGIGNRPGRFDFNSGPNWPYGRRVTVFPVWAGRNGMMFPRVDFQNADDSNLSHQANQSSREVHFCRPLQKSESSWDAASCPSPIYTDKGVLTAGTVTGYPPRSDVNAVPGQDSDSVEQYKAMNPFDAVSGATPRMGVAAEVSWPIPPDLPMGDYILFMEVSLEQDFNATYNSTTYPSPPGIPWAEFGVPYRGQPSVVYSAPVSISDQESITTTDAYIGYGDPNGGPMLHPPDSTITANVPNSGAARLLLTSSNGKMFRLRVDARPEQDHVSPGTPGNMVVANAQSSDATLTFVAPGDDGTTGTVQGYDVRYRVGNAPMGDADFATANDARFTGDVVRAGELQTLIVHDLLPETPYSVAVRAYDECHNTSSITTATFTTAARKIGEVDACFVATAAYGSLLANDVEMLRRFRDRTLKHSVLGELAVETYYTFGPTVAGVVGESDLLRATARQLLTPLVRWVGKLH
jgi:fibronectin type III domain protein